MTIIIPTRRSLKVPLPLQYNVHFWLSAQYPTGNSVISGIANNAHLSPWPSIGNTAISVSQATTSAQPIFLANDGGSPSINASSASSQYYSPTVTFNYSTANTIVAVCGTPSNSSVYLFGGNGSGSAPGFIYGFVANTWEFYNTPDRQTFGTATSGFHTLAIVQTDAVNCKGYFDGTQEFTFTPTVAFSGKHLGTIFSSQGTANFVNGSLKDFLIFRYALSSTQLTNLFTYLNYKNGL